MTDTIAFEALLNRLQGEGFRLSPDDYIEFTAVFGQFEGSREELKYYLAPILCRSREEQVRFYAIYDAYVTPPQNVQRVARPMTNPNVTQATAGYFLKRASRLYYAWVVVFSLLAVTVRVVKALRQPAPSHLVAIAPVKTDSGKAAAAPVVKPARKFVVKAAPRVRALRPEDKSVIIPQGQSIEQESHVHSTAFAWLFILGTTCLILSVSFFPLRRSKNLPHVDVDKLRGDGGPLDIPFQPKDALIRDLPILARLARDLAQPLPTEVYRLEMRKTIRASIKAYGMLTPVFERLERRPEWVIIADSGQPLRACLYRYLSHTLARYSLPVYFYVKTSAGSDAADDETSYAQDSRIANEAPINGYRLRQRHGDARVIDFDEGTIPEPLSAVFEFGPVFGRIAHIREYLNDEDLFQWLCAAAVYPTVRWEVLISVGAAVLKERGVLHKLNFECLLKLTRIDWLNRPSGSIPDEMRLELLKSLGVAEELATRRAILELLKESDGIILDSPATFEEKMTQVYTQSFILFAHDTRKNAVYESDARKFMNVWNRRRATDLATVLYLSNPDGAWATPVRSAEDSRRIANADRFINELLALKLVANPRIRAFFRNMAASFFFVLLLLYLFKDSIQPTGLNAALGLVDRDYPAEGVVTVKVPVTDCLRKMVHGRYLLVMLNNYDNNQYTALVDLNGRDTVSATFSGVTMAGKDSSQATFQLVLNKTLTVETASKEYYSGYVLVVRGVDCEVRLPVAVPAAGWKGNY